MRRKISDFITGVMLNAYMALTLCYVLVEKRKKKTSARSKDMEARRHPQVSKA